MEASQILTEEEVKVKVGEIVGRGTPGTFIVVKVVGLVDVRDKYGADSYRQVRNLVLERISSLKRQSDIIGRIEEDVYVLYYTRRQPEDFLRDKCEYLNSVIRSKVDELMGAQKVEYIGVSLGISRVPDEGRTFSTLYDKAYSALSNVLDTGRNGYEIYKDDNRSHIRDEDVSPALAVLKARISEPGTPSGAYKVRSNEFTVLYQFCQRFCPDMQICAGMVLFTMKKKNRSEVSDEDLKDIYDDFFSLLYNSLRRRDVVTRYSEDQILAVFTAEDQFGLHAAIDRILDSWKKTEGCKEVNVEAEMLVMMGDE